MSATSRSVAEDSAVGAEMGPALAGSDPDAGSVLAYIITGGNTGSAFGVNQLTGMLFVASPLDFETQTSYSLSLRVQDGGGLSQDATVTVTVTNVNEAPVVTPDQGFSISEAAAAESVLGSLTAADPESDAITFTIASGNDGTQFAIDGATLKRAAGAPALNYETRQSFSLVVRAADASGASSTGTVLVTVLDVQEPPQFLASSPITRAVQERSVAGTVVGAPLLASDPEGDTLTFALVSQPASGNFYACSSDGQLSVAAGQSLPAISGGTSTHTLVVVRLLYSHVRCVGVVGC